MLKGLANLLAAMHLSSIAEWLTTLTTLGKKEGKKKTKKRRTGLFLCPHPSAGIFCLWFLLFSITKGSFHRCQLNESLCVLHPIPTHHSLSLAGTVSSSSFLCILPYKYNFCENAAVCFLWFQSLKKRSISNHSQLSLSWLQRCTFTCCLVDHVALSTLKSWLIECFLRYIGRAIFLCLWVN